LEHFLWVFQLYQDAKYRKRVSLNAKYRKRVSLKESEMCMREVVATESTVGLGLPPLPQSLTMM